MKKNTFYTAVLLLAGTVLTACSGGDDVTSDITPVSQPAAETGDVVELSGTLGGKSSTTRAIAENGTGTWEVGDKFAVYYETSNGHASAVATVNSVYSDGSAHFKATLRSPKSGDNSVKLVYPASAHNGEGGFKTDGLMNQGGTLEYINQNGLDIETATATMSVEGMTAKLTEEVTMQPQVCLYKMTLHEDYYTLLNTTKLEINDDKGHSYTITPTPTSATSEFTIAMLPVIYANFTFTATTTEEYGIFTKQEGLTLANCTADNVGDVFDKDGNIYKVSSAPGAIYNRTYNGRTLYAGKFYTSEPYLNAVTTVSPGIAMIAYVGDNGSVETGSDYKGLAVAMADCNKYNCSVDIQQFSGTSWCNQNDNACTKKHDTNVGVAREWKDGISKTDSLLNNTDGHTHNAAKAASTYNTPYPSGTSGWFLASLGQWQLIMQGLITKVDNQPYSVPISTSGNAKMASDYYDSVLKNAGTGFSYCYWTSSEYDAYDGWGAAPSNGSAFTYSKTSSSMLHVRAVIAF